MNDNIELIDRAREVQWQRPLANPATIRARGRRRTQARWGAGAAAACAVAFVATVAVAPLFGDSDRPQVATDGPASTGDLNLGGTSFRLPATWRVLSEPAAGQACVGPDSDAAGCAVRVAVTTKPEAMPDEGLDVVPALMASCAASDPRFVEVTHPKPGTSIYTGSCTQDSPAMTAWALDNRGMYVIATDQRFADEGAAVFENANVPDSWTKQPSAPTSEAPSPLDGPK